MGIYDRALSPSRLLAGQSTGLLGMVGQPQPPGGAGQIPQTTVGNVDFESARVAERAVGISEQQELTSSLLQLGTLGATLGADYIGQRKPEFSGVGKLAPGAFAAQEGTFGNPGFGGGRRPSPFFDLNQGGSLDLNTPGGLLGQSY